jgi:uncharacterized Ntn-hydrolase superfamily protein
LRRVSDVPAFGTYSIVAADPEAREVGCAVQSRYFSVGAAIPWVRAGVGAVATQAFVLSASGPQILDALASGEDPATALQRVVDADDVRGRRQYGVMTADGRGAAYTGPECGTWAGHRTGECYAVQGNILAGPDVVASMAVTFEASQGSGRALADRLMDALDAAEAAGGDLRGKQSSALVVDRTGAADVTPRGIDRVVDLRVDDHPEPLDELRRLLGIHWSLAYSLASYWHYERGDYEGAIEAIQPALRRSPETALGWFNVSCYEALAGRREDALEHLRRAVELDPSVRAQARADRDFDALRSDDAFVQIVGS